MLTLVRHLRHGVTACYEQHGETETSVRRGGAGRAALLLTRPLKPTAKRSDSSDFAPSWEAANRHLSQDMSCNMSGPVSIKPVGTTSALAAPVLLAKVEIEPR
jgi:hypothetical protein